MAPFDAETAYYRFTREERYFCAVLTHLLLASGDAVRSLLALLDEQLQTEHQPSLGDIASWPIDEAQVYFEPAIPRDIWSTFGAQSTEPPSARNAGGRAFILDVFTQVPTLASLSAHQFPASVGDFNAEFIGPAGKSITQDIASPALWSVVRLHDLAQSLARPGQSHAMIFRDLCKLKWSFRIKPDILVGVPGQKPICIEAKLLSPEGHYPTLKAEARLFDALFQPPEQRVRQIELQDFLFTMILRSEATHMMIGSGQGPLYLHNAAGQDVKIPVISWNDIFDRIGRSSSIPFVTSFVHENVHIHNASAIESGNVRVDGQQGRYFDGIGRDLNAILSLIDERRRQGQETQIGFVGGASVLSGTTLDDLISRRWRWRDPTTNTGSYQRRNWVDANDFVRIIEDMQRSESDAG